jgi:hypothetical protein
MDLDADDEILWDVNTVPPGTHLSHFPPWPGGPTRAEQASLYGFTCLGANRAGLLDVLKQQGAEALAEAGYPGTCLDGLNTEGLSGGWEVERMPALLGTCHSVQHAGP